MEVIIVLLAFALGIFVAFVYDNLTVDGTLKVDKSDQDGPYLFLEIKNLNSINKKKYVTLKVNTINYIPHE